MTVQEMHIGLDQILQKVNSKQTDSFKDQEKDWALNEECLRFIKQRTNPLSNSKHEGLEDTQKRYDDVAELITSATLSSYYRDSNSVFSFLPVNYFSLINDRSSVKDLCNIPFKTLIPSTEIKKVCIVPFPNAIETSAPYYNNLSFIKTDDNTVLFDINNYITTVNGLNSKKEKFYIINLALDIMNKLYPLYDEYGTQNTFGIEIKWENFNGVYYKDSFIFIVTGLPLFTGVTIQPSNTLITSIDTLFKKFDVINTQEVPNRLCKTEDLYTLLNTNFATTFAHSPISSLSRGKINVHHKQKFILNFVSIDYIRKPRKIDLILNQSCELNPNVHEEIVENTAKRLAGITKGENYQQLMNETLLTE